MIFLRYPFHSNLKTLSFESEPARANLVKDSVESHLGYNDFSLFYNGRKLHDMDVIPDNSTIYVTFSLAGGKGGFGSMLRAIGAQIEKTTNREACRDLSGRRLRDINEETRLKKWIAKEAEREAEKIKRRQARLERLKTKAPHHFFDYEYEKEISQLPDRINDALSEGLQKAKLPQKRSHEKSATELPKKSWLTDDLPMSSSDSEADETNAAVDGSSSKKLKIASNNITSCDSHMSESSQPQPGCSKDFANEESTSNDISSAFTSGEKEENSTDSDKEVVIQEEKNEECGSNVINPSIIEMENSQGENRKNCNAEEIIQENKDTEKCSTLCESGNTSIEQPEKKDISPINLLDFQSVSDLEALGLDKLKSALMSRGLKCGGTLSDRAQRLWKIRGLQPNEYPANLRAKNKK